MRYKGIKCKKYKKNNGMLQNLGVIVRKYKKVCQKLRKWVES